MRTVCHLYSQSCIYFPYHIFLAISRCKGLKMFVCLFKSSVVVLPDESNPYLQCSPKPHILFHAPEGVLSEGNMNPVMDSEQY